MRRNTLELALNACCALAEQLALGARYALAGQLALGACFALAGQLALAPPLRAAGQAAKPQASSDATRSAEDVLRAADRALRAAERLRYRAVHRVRFPDGFELELPDVRGNVAYERLPAPLAPDSIGARLSVVGTEDAQRAGAEARAFRLAYDGRTLRSSLAPERVVRESQRASAAVYPANRLLAQHLLDRQGLAREFLNTRLELLPQETIGGVRCACVRVRYPASASTREREFAFGLDDHLPRRIRAPFELGGATGSEELELSELELVAAFAPADFAYEPPAGWTVTSDARGAPEAAASASASSPAKTPAAQPASRPASQPSSQPARPGRAALLAVGALAPDFELPLASGGTQSLSALRGRVVVLDFWASWCAPCRKSMPELSQLHRRFELEPVSVLGMNAYEDAGVDAQAVARALGCEYPQLLGAERIAPAFGVERQPTLFVIDVDGRVLHVEVGYDIALAERVGAQVTRALRARR